jgi:hypothetical protein
MERPSKIPKEVLPYIESLENELNVFKLSPYVKTYLSILVQVDNFNNQLTSQKIDLFADKDQKEFDRSWKYMLESVDMLEKLDKLRKLMTPEQQKEAQKQIDIKNLGMAEKIALKSAGNGKN